MVRIALIHAVLVAMPPVEKAFRDDWPEARSVNLVDDALPADLEQEGMTPRMMSRIEGLARQAIDSGADGVLFTCSAFGSAIEAAASKWSVPVLKPNEAMFDAALSIGPRIGMLATFAASVPSMEEDFRESARRRGMRVELQTVCVPEALVAARLGDYETHNRLLAQAAPRLAHCDAVMLAHFSTAPALASVQAVLDRPVLTSPGAAVLRLKQLLSP